MPIGNPFGGAGYAAEFQSSALPWVTSSVAPAQGSPIEIDFNYVTRFISISVSGSAGTTLSVGFTQRGVATSNNKFVISAGQTMTWEWRCAKLFIQGENGTPSYSLGVGLTTIPVKNFPLLTGSSAMDDGTNWAGVG